MKYLNLTKKLYWVIALSVLFANTLVVFYLYHQFVYLAENRAYSNAKSLEDYFVSMRRVYHQQFLESGIDLNDSTVGFLPAHASALISTEFSKITHEGITIRNVSDRPRNEVNRADSLEAKAIEYFTLHSNAKEKMEQIEQNGKSFYFYTSPLRIESYCLACHGPRNEVIPYISKHYDTAYDYKLGDVRGITSIKIPASLVLNEIIGTFWKGVAFNGAILFLLLVLIYIAIKELTQQARQRREDLEILVVERTSSLQKTSIELQNTCALKEHLYSVLRTVADTNQILITAQTLEELLKNVASCLFANDSFAYVKIIVLEDNILHVKQSFGFEDDYSINELERYVFEHRSSLKVFKDSPFMTDECREKFIESGVTESYITVLSNNKIANNVLGVLHVCTYLSKGFSEEEHEMIEELAGDVGFAINSFLQKENILKLSYYDTLTNLANKIMLTEQIHHTINTCKKEGTFGALLFMDLDNFKSINDLKGYSAGDQLLITMAERLNTLAPLNSVVSRFGGDEFVLLISSLGNNIEETAKKAEKLAESIMIAVKEPFNIDNHPFHLTVSIGISILSAQDNVELLLSRADSAMYLAKKSGKNTICFFDDSIQRAIEQKSLMLLQLYEAIELKQFILHYQIQVNQNQQIEGVEALVRWMHPLKGFVPPLEFISLCEESGLIIPLGKWVLYQAIHQCVLWQSDEKKAYWRISVNVSAKQFQQDDFVAMVEEAIITTGVPAHLIRLELTENLLIGDFAKAMGKIKCLKSLGISLSIDDFGTGYSSLQYLKQLSLDELKIDQSFIKDCLTEKNDATIVETMLSIGEKLGIDVIAEGVETNEQFEYLKSLGCIYFQGYFFGKPCLPDAL